MKVLITGATGLVGRAITKALLEQDVPVNYLTTKKGKIVSSPNHKGFFWNPASNDIDLYCFEGVTVIINLAGASIAKKWTSSYKQKVLSSRLDSLDTLKKGLEKSKNSKVKHFISASAIGIYPSSHTDLYEEKEPDVDSSFLGYVVEKWEKGISGFETLPLNVATVRIGIVLSDEGGALPKMVKPIKNYVGAIMGNGEQWQSWIHIDDLVQIFLFIISNKLKGTYNAVAPNPVTNAKMTKELAKVLKRPLVLPNVPQFMMNTMLGEMAYLLFSSQRVCSKRIEKKGFTFQYANIGAALHHLLGAKKSKQTSTVVALDKEYV